MKFTEREAYVINCLAVFGIDILSKDKDLETLNSLYNKGIIFCTEVLNKDRSLDNYKVKISFRSEHLAKAEIENMRKNLLDLQSKQYWNCEPPYIGRMSDPDQHKLTIIRD